MAAAPGPLTEAASADPAPGLNRTAVLHLNTDWGRIAKDVFSKAAPGLGIEVTAAEPYLAAEQDFRPALARAREGKPDGLVLLSYYADGALICRQARDAGVPVPVLAVTSAHSPGFIGLGGAGVEGVYVMNAFFPGDPQPEVQGFVGRYRAKYGQDPDSFSALCDQDGTTREAMQEGLLAIRDVPSVIHGKATFDQATRRVQGTAYKLLTVKDGQSAAWDGARAKTG